MTSLNNLTTHSSINNIVIGLVLSDSCRILRENQVIKLKFRGNVHRKEFFNYIYNLIES